MSIEHNFTSFAKQSSHDATQPTQVRPSCNKMTRSFNTSPLQHKSHLDIKTALVFNLATQCLVRATQNLVPQHKSVHATTKPSLRKTTRQIGPFPSATLGTQALLEHTHTNKLTKLPCNTALRNLSLLIFPATQNSISRPYIVYATQGPATQKS